MKIFITIVFFILFSRESLSEELQKAYFAGGCFWCMEESFDKVNGVTKTTSGYSGGHVENPSYKQVVYEETGHLETVEVIFDNKIIKYEDILNDYFKNIDPFDFEGQFCDKGESYRPEILYKNKEKKKLIEKKIKDIEKKFDKKTFVLIKEFQKFYKAEDYHQDYYQKNFLSYLAYKNGCQRTETLNKIWKN